MSADNFRMSPTTRNTDLELPREAGSRGIGQKWLTRRGERKGEEPRGKRARIEPKSRIDKDSGKERNQRTEPLSRIEDDPICFDCHRRGHTKSDCPRDESQRRTRRDADKRELSYSYQILLAQSRGTAKSLTRVKGKWQ